ncbi:hypothetical protein JRO89_XS12G0236600 [Xanthoceras sorbifolium]|uniref:Uncharacterized protein n=1 Tax=Xanthoceras sorbifolium TaxID=99658 RepID=A0ABQ8HDJ7_9ROSI|nr:hypothetical protein JRO89_XS12G0236600 [Xanthoceras sorbifolium]
MMSGVFNFTAQTGQVEGEEDGVKKPTFVARGKRAKAGGDEECQEINEGEKLGFVEYTTLRLHLSTHNMLRGKNCDNGGTGQSKNAANLSHMAQWESARLEAEARLVRESKLRSHNSSSFEHHHQHHPHHLISTSASASLQLLNKSVSWSSTTLDLESPTSTLTFSENNNNNPNNGVPPVMTTTTGVSSLPQMIELAGNSGSSEDGLIKEEGDHHHDWKGLGSSSNNNLAEYRDGIENSLSFTSTLHDMNISMEVAAPWTPESLVRTTNGHVLNSSVGNSMEEGFTNLLLNDSAAVDDHRSLSDSCRDSDNSGGGCGDGSDSGGSDYYQDNKNYWNSILNLVNSSPPTSPSPLF